MNKKDKIIETALAVIVAGLLIVFITIYVNAGRSTTEIAIALVCMLVITLVLANILERFTHPAVLIGIGLCATVIAVVSEPTVETLIGIIIGWVLTLISKLWI